MTEKLDAPFIVWNADKTEGFVTTDRQLAYEVRKSSDTNCFDFNGRRSDAGIAFCEAWGEGDCTMEPLITPEDLQAKCDELLAKQPLKGNFRDPEWQVARAHEELDRLSIPKGDSDSMYTILGRFRMAFELIAGMQLHVPVTHMCPQASFKWVKPSVLLPCTNPAALVAPSWDDKHLNWAVSRWNAEVKDRPLNNIHRRSLDDAWRQVITQLGGDADALVGPAHDALVDSQGEV